MTTSLRLGESRIPYLCRRAKISQAEFARRLGVPRQTIYKINRRERDLSFEQAVNAAHILGCRVEDLHRIELGNRTE